MVKVLYEERNMRLQGESSKPPNGEGSSGGKGGDEEKASKGNDDKPPHSPPQSSSSQSSLSSSTTTPSQTPPQSPKGYGKTPLLKLNSKLELPMYNGEVNAEGLGNWVRQLEVYCRIQKIKDDETNIQLASLRFKSASLIWWEAKTQEEMKKHGMASTSWKNFITTFRRKSYPLAYIPMAIMDQ